jgi:hypothetical protein
MSVMCGALYDALRCAEVPESLAHAAATSAAGNDGILAAIDIYVALMAAKTPPPVHTARAAALEVGRLRQRA